MEELEYNESLYITALLLDTYRDDKRLINS